MARTFSVEPITLSELRHLDLRLEAAQAFAPDWTEWPDGEIAETLSDLDGRQSEQTFDHMTAAAFRIHIAGESQAAEALLVNVAGRIGIAWGADADWQDITIPEDDDDAAIAAVEAAVARWLIRDDDLVTSGDIAQLAGVQAATVQAWTERHVSFPAPEQTFGATRAWRWSDVAAWLAVPRRSGRPRKG